MLFRSTVLDGGWRSRRHHVQQFQIRPGRFESSRFARREQHARAFLSHMSLIIKMNNTVGRALHRVNEVVVLVRLDVELPARNDGPPVNG